MHFLLPLLLFLSLSEPGVAETGYSISGIVVDSETGETLPSATVLIGDGLSGTITNREGEFSFTAEELPVSITVRYIGYNSVTMELDEESEFPVTIELTPSRTELDEVVVTDRDPGLSIMELVIERKKLWREDLNNYRVDAYTRQTIASDTGIVSITESQSEAYWDHRYGHREVQRSRRQTSNLGADQNFAGVRYLPNFYDDNIEIAGYRMVGITHPDALRYYRFRLLETTQMDGVPVYKIGVEPRRERQPLFEGVAWVLGREYALLEVNLKPNDVVNFPPPVQEFDLSYMQQFSNYGGVFWLPVDVRIEGKIRIAMVGLRFPAINFRQISRLSGYELNTEIPDSVFRDSPLLVRLDSVPGAPPTELEELDGSVPLTADERRAYATIDSTRTLEEAFRPEGFLARMIERQDERTGPQGFGANLSGISPRAGFNRVDGYQLGANYNRRFRDIGLRVDGYAGYNFFGKEWDTGVEIGQRILTGGGRSLSIFGGYHRATDTQYHSGYVGRFMNSTVTLLGGDDYFDYFRNEKIETGLRVRNLVPRSQLTISARRELHRTHNREGIYDHSLFGWHTERRVNPEIEEGELRSLDFRLALNEQPGISGIAGSRSAIFSVEWSSPDLGSDFDFLRAEGTVTWNVETFYTRRLFANMLDLKFSAGASTGDLPIQRSLSVDGSLSAFGPFGTIKTRRGVPYTGTEYWLAYAEHNFRTIPFELIGLNPLVERGWGIILFGGAAQASGAMPGGGDPSGSVHSEVGVSLNSILGILRLDFAKRLDAPGTFIGLSVPRYF